jgi:hypothetical protein
MGFWQRLMGGEPAEGRSPQDVLPELLASYQEEVRLARQIREHAERAPHQAGTQGLLAVADVQDRVVRLLGDKIATLGGSGRDGAGPLKSGKNHWARVVHDLEDNHALEQHYNEQAIHWDPALSDMTALFRTLEREKHQISVLLRDIALRADPHALD